MLMRILWYSVSYWSSGVVRGCGRQKAGAFINLAAYYLAGIPSAFVFAFVWHLGGMASVPPSWPFQHFNLGLHYFPSILQLLFLYFFIRYRFWTLVWFELWTGALVRDHVWIGSADAPAALHHIVHQLEQGGKQQFTLSSMQVVFLLFSCQFLNWCCLFFMGKLLQALKAKNRVSSSALPVDIATAWGGLV